MTPGGILAGASEELAQALEELRDLARADYIRRS
jgi:hypothetical protein